MICRYSALVLLCLASLAGIAKAAQDTKDIPKADFVLVEKSKYRLHLKKNGKVFKTFKVVFGDSPKGHKQQEGDEKTPEGRYKLDFKNIGSGYYKSIRISYPNATDRKKARDKGVAPGGDVMIHGQKNGFGWFAPVMQLFNWTNGCIAVNNKDMEFIWRSVDVGTPIEILP